MEYIEETPWDYLRKEAEDRDYRFCCDRCGTTATAPPEQLVDQSYLVDDAWMATGNCCPACALDDDPHHIPGSWLLTWG